MSGWPATPSASANQPTFAVAEELQRVAVGAASSAVVEQHCRERIGLTLS